ncbi:uncharacterized protein BYT42DRAFT_583986 [Radiomyces spectabilis]|uniref:uncharacterized protein n=1 Tax=Radiomyces spectabilis TaxID=64574 RepID=UPI00221E9738|nr:uncharacterized protein BYT42DRAFT_583986 [Radiomyces spectabilis]KAI8369330.1 hypothetical protein BYT42DRAFT_583986 [Radiomyces spectabilis]
MSSPSPMKWWFHNEVQNLHLLFEPFQLNDRYRLFAGYVFIVVVCWSERAITYYLDRLAYSRGRISWRLVTTRTLLFGVATVLRLWYMLIAMYFNTGLFIVMVIALTGGQFAVELLKASSATTETVFGRGQKNLNDSESQALAPQQYTLPEEYEMDHDGK